MRANLLITFGYSLALAKPSYSKQNHPVFCISELKAYLSNHFLKTVDNLVKNSKHLKVHMPSVKKYVIPDDIKCNLCGKIIKVRPCSIGVLRTKMVKKRKVFTLVTISQNLGIILNLIWFF